MWMSSVRSLRWSTTRTDFCSQSKRTVASSPVRVAPRAPAVFFVRKFWLYAVWLPSSYCTIAEPASWLSVGSPQTQRLCIAVTKAGRASPARRCR